MADVRLSSSSSRGLVEQPLLASQGSVASSTGGRGSLSGGSGGLRRVTLLLALVVLALLASTAQMGIQAACRQVGGNTTSSSSSSSQRSPRLAAAAAAPSPSPPPKPLQLQPKPRPPPEQPQGQRQQATAAFAAIPALTQLHNQLLRKSHDYIAHREVMLATLDELVHMSDQAAAAAINQQLQESREPAQLFTLQLYELLLGTGKLIPCREDTTLVVNDPLHLPGGGSAGGNRTMRYYFATNLRDNAANMPQFTLSLLQTLLRLPHGTVFVSAYESNSDDGAHGWIDVLQLALNVIGTPSDLVTRGMLVRLDGTHRIEHLARARNMALAPLYQHYAATRGQQQQQHEGSGGREGSGTSTSKMHGRRSLQGPAAEPNFAGSSTSSPSSTWASLFTSSSSSSQRRRLHAADVSDAAHLPPGVLPWSPDFIVFINDVFFCHSMVLRLLNHRADLTCGMDWWQNQDATVDLPAQLRRKAGLPKPSIPAEYRLERPIDQPMAADQRNPIVFYDVWVARDLSGAKFWWNHPFVHDPTTTAAAQKGLPFRASCCWNGLAVLRAAPFAAGLRIRQPMQGECQGSECSMLCDDFARLGYRDVVVDAGVQLSYNRDTSREMMALGIEGVGQTTWAQAKAAGIAGADKQAAFHAMECCGLRPNAEFVSFHSDCGLRSILERNFTREFLAQAAKQ